MCGSTRDRSSGLDRLTRLRLGILVSIPEPFSSQIDGVRRALGSVGVSRIHPHVTVVPPFNLKAADLIRLDRLIATKVDGLEPFIVTIRGASTFSDDSPVLYFEVTDGADQLQDLHRSLATGDLAPRHERSFVPHVTIADGLNPVEIAHLKRNLSGFNATFQVDRVDLCEKQNVAGSMWVRDSSWLFDDLSTTVSIGADRIELFVRGGFPNSCLTWLQSEGFSDAAVLADGNDFGKRLAFVATAGERIAGVALVNSDGGAFNILAIHVALEFRLMGLGTRLVRRIVARAQADGSRAILSQVAPEFLDRLGFVASEEAKLLFGSQENGMMLYRLNFSS